MNFYLLLIIVIQVSQSVSQPELNSGIIARIERKSFFGLTQVLSKLLPTYIFTDLDLPYEYEYRYFSPRWGSLGPKVMFTNISQTQPNLEFKDVRFELTKSPKTGENTLFVDFPAIK